MKYKTITFVYRPVKTAEHRYKVRYLRYSYDHVGTLNMYLDQYAYL